MEMSERCVNLDLLENAHASLRRLLRTHIRVGYLFFAFPDCSCTNLVTICETFASIAGID